MKTIGLLGGMSWESTVTYYRLINEFTQQELGGHHSAPCVLYSVDFAVIERLQHAGRWAEAAGHLSAAARRVEAAGAEFLVLCTNTMHKVAEAIQAVLRIPFLHIADATGQAITRAGLTRIGLLGTRFTMEDEFYRGHLEQKFGLRVRTPNEADRAEVHRIIYDELCLGRIRPASRAQMRQILGRLVREGAEGIILGCTELGLLIEPDDSPVPLFDTTRLHARAAVAEALKKPDTGD